MKTSVPGALGVVAPSRLRLGPSVTVHSCTGEVMAFKGTAAVVMAWVALEGHADRRRLSAVLWPDSDAVQARSNLRVLMHRIHQRCGAELLVGGESLAFDAHRVQVELVDAGTLLEALAAGGVERCELLAEASLDAAAEEPLRAWLEAARQRLRRQQLDCLDEALAKASAQGQPDLAVALARGSVQLDPLSEQRHRRLMEVLERMGDRAAALSAYEDCRRLLREQLGVLPSPQTRAVQLRILQEQALGPAAAATQGLPTEVPGTLGGVARYPLVEREILLRQAHAAIGMGLHLVLHGEPGVGKTRLLHHFASWAGGEMETVGLRSALRHEPYGALAQWLQEVQPRRTPTLGVPEQIELGRLAPLTFAAVRPSEAALSVSRLHAALRHWCERLHDAGVRVLVLDDVQYADAASQAALASLLEDAPAARAGPVLLLAYRSGEVAPVLEQAVTDAQARRRARRIELPRLSPVGVASLLQAIGPPVGPQEAETLAQRLHRQTGGNPLFVIELAQQARDGVAGSGDTADLQALLAASLSACSSRAQQLATVAAVAAEAFTVDLAVAVTGHPALEWMPAWRELQQRGLFAGHGLAHDLIRDAVLAGLPAAIRQGLHRQVAEHLEALGERGATVLQHWLSAADADRALPHAACQLHAANAAGVPTVQAAQVLLGVLERASDRLLLQHLWLTAEIDISLTRDFGPETPWQRLRALRQRVERLPGHDASAVWLAFETARERWHLDGSVKAAYEALLPVAERLPRRGVERARVEHALSLYANQLTSEAREHVRRARDALEGLADEPALIGLRAMIDTASAVFEDPVQGLRRQAGRWRAARRRGDLALVVAARVHMAYTLGALGCPARAWRHYVQAAAGQGLAPGDMEASHARYRAGIHALDAGHYAMSRQLLVTSGNSFSHVQPLFLALIHLRLGEWVQAQEQAACIDADLARRDAGVLFTCAFVDAELRRLQGQDPLPVLARHLADMREQGVGGARLQRMAWELSLLDRPAAARLADGEALLKALRCTGSHAGILAKAMLEVAETRAVARAAGSTDLAAEAARLLRRGCTTSSLYLPDGLLRCARLLQRADPGAATALVQVADRWVREAQRRLPDAAARSFADRVPVNRALLRPGRGPVPDDVPG